MKWNPEDYRSNSSAQHAWALELLEKLRLEGAERVIDIGCGDGRVTAEIAARVPRGRVLGVDRSVEMIEYARAQLGQNPRLGFEVADARELAGEGEYDVAFSNATLHWITGSHQPVLERLSRVLRRGGRLLFSMGGRGNAVLARRAVERVIAGERWRPLFEGVSYPWGFHGPEDYRRWLESAGFEPTRVELVPKEMRHSREALAGWFRTTWLPYTDRVRDAERAAFVEECVARCCEDQPVGSDGTVSIPMVRLEVEAVRR